MYLLVALADLVEIPPQDLEKPPARAIEDLINAKFADKVIFEVGLCVGFHSIIKCSEGKIASGSGHVAVNVDFRLIVYRPFKGEIVHGTITHSNPRAGVYLSQDFFEDIVVPPETLFDGTAWGVDDQGVEAFIWNTNDNEYFFDRAESCLFRVEEEQWVDMSPQTKSPGGQFIAEDAQTEGEKKKTPYLVRGSMMLSGLGPTLWWSGEQIEGEEDGG
ncbi:DNA-directed RNA polymerase III complex subunit Rpc25 [Saxophila tyrrhenica]|uniref:DNA-directed RNA polymerase subunit n=1 Tax=Saxophila tyrrhenica TaxID=1690608 RepID=A0AAV9PKQ0_9PEZI|nr:DNA-directed RNA polymerase III complex subunit Rpc25 [Saxophila tyrrhenica]